MILNKKILEYLSSSDPELENLGIALLESSNDDMWEVKKALQYDPDNIIKFSKDESNILKKIRARWTND